MLCSCWRWPTCRPEQAGDRSLHGLLPGSPHWEPEACWCPPAGPQRERLVLVHLLRMGVANCSRPLTRAMLMDNVPSRLRARWNAADSIRQFSWAGSAALGGWLIERSGYGSTFVYTAVLKVWLGVSFGSGAGRRFHEKPLHSMQFLCMAPMVLLTPLEGAAAVAAMRQNEPQQA